MRSEVAIASDVTARNASHGLCLYYPALFLSDRCQFIHNLPPCVSLTTNPSLNSHRLQNPVVWIG
ncbi:uncharacterized protein H6S33_006835 [Morchella sextelata]|uniref:uncharacterized protein n=1 Tax=Morchella sextelata TaxID=1174677 RepID=UPI001D03FBE3|nr:uncharacterized protein H6S33_006835 [Morchella sextelata]KAH0604458.1 hypothetical protein H6S33_006835 [Morchella sextelata]